MNNKILHIILKVIIVLMYVALSYYFFSLIDNKYEKKIPQIFWAIIFVLFIIGFSLERKNKRKVLTISMMSLLIIVQGSILLVPKLHEFIYDLFAWSSF
jgi:hypothetical protein